MADPVGQAGPVSEDRLISVLMCTYRRPQVIAALRSVFAQRLPAGIALELVVADNDAEPSGRAAVDAARAEAPFPVIYVHAPKGNISIARNACLDRATGDLVAFIDDDETAAPDWIARLVERFDATGADGIFGPALAQYPAAAATWMREQDHHSNVPVLRDGAVRTGHTCNALLRWKGKPWAGERFDVARGVSGGEDTEFFFRLARLGATYDLTLEARVWEPVDEKRLSYAWIRRRKFRMGQSYASAATGVPERAKLFAVAGAKAAYCQIRGSLGRDEGGRAFWHLRGAMHAGVCAGCLGATGVAIYGG